MNLHFKVLCVSVMGWKMENPVFHLPVCGVAEIDQSTCNSFEAMIRLSIPFGRNLENFKKKRHNFPPIVTFHDRRWIVAYWRPGLDHKGVVLGVLTLDNRILELYTDVPCKQFRQDCPSADSAGLQKLADIEIRIQAGEIFDRISPAVEIFV